MTRSMPEAATQQFVTQIPLGRMGCVDDVVYAVLFLCSPSASAITGTTLTVAGGEI